MRFQPSVIGGFLLRAACWLMLMLGLWWWLRDWVVLPVVWLAGQVMDAVFPWVDRMLLESGKAVLVTRMTVLQGGAQGVLAPEVNVLKYCFGLPLAMALLLATRSGGLLWKAPLAAVVLVPFQAWGVCFGLLMQISVHMGSVTDAVTQFSELQRNGFALGAQLGYLVLPTLVPVLLWAWMERAFIATVMVEGSLKGALGRS